MTDLVVGGAGFIGRHLVELLLAEGRRVRVLDIEPTPGLPPAVEVMPGSVEDAALVRSAVRGVRRIYHLAGNPHLWAADKSAFERVNVGGTRNVLAAAAAAPVERIVYTSSPTVFAGRRVPTDARAVDERVERTLAEMPGPYCRSKWRAEQVALAAARRGLPVVVVNPTLPLGPGDWRLTPPSRMVLDFLRGRHPAFLDWSLNVIDVRDVALGHLLAAERGRIGERYILAGAQLSMARLLMLLEEITGLPMPRRRVPGWLAWLTGAVSELVADHVTHRPPLAPLTGVRLARRNVRFDGAKAARELGLAPRPLRGTLVDATAWLIAAGLLRPDARRAPRPCAPGLPVPLARPHASGRIDPA